MVDTMMERKRQAELDARTMAINEAAAKRAEELFPLQKAGAELQNAASQQVLDYNNDTKDARVQEAKGRAAGVGLQNTATQQAIDYSNDTKDARVQEAKDRATGVGLQNTATQQAIDYSNETKDSRIKAANLAVDTAQQALATAKQAYEQADRTNPEALKALQVATANAQQTLDTARSEQAALQRLGQGGGSPLVQVDDLVNNPSALSSIRPKLDNFLTQTGGTGKPLSFSRLIKYGEDKYIVTVHADGQTKEVPITTNRTSEGSDTVRFFTKDELNKELASMQAPAPSLASAQVPVSGRTKVNEEGFSTYAPQALKEADRTYAEKNLAALGVDKTEWRKTVLGMVAQESGFHPSAVSPAGASGLTQVMAATGRKPGYNITPLKDQSPEENLRFGADYLATMVAETKGNLPNALAAYNGGLGNVQKYNGPIPNSKENQAYPKLVQMRGADMYDKAVALTGEAAAPPTATAPTAPAPTAPAPTATAAPTSAISADNKTTGKGFFGWVGDKISQHEAKAEKAQAAYDNADFFSGVARTGLRAAISPMSEAQASERSAPSAEMGARYWASRKDFAPGGDTPLPKDTLKLLDEHYAAFKPSKPTAPAATTRPFASTGLGAASAPSAPGVVSPAPEAVSPVPAAAPASGLTAAANRLTPEQRSDALTLAASRNPAMAAIGSQMLGIGKSADKLTLLHDGDRFAAVNNHTGAVVNRGTIGNGAPEATVPDKKELERRSAITSLVEKQNPGIFSTSYTDSNGKVHTEKDPALAQRFLNMVNTTVAADMKNLDITSPAVQPVLAKAFTTALALEKKLGYQVFESLTPVLMLNYAGISEAKPKEMETVMDSAIGLTEVDHNLSLSDAMTQVLAPRHPIAGKLMQGIPNLRPADAMQYAMQISAEVDKAIANGDKRSKAELVNLAVSQLTQPR